MGYYVHYQYVGEELPENLPSLPAADVVKMTKRTILFDKPRVTKFNIKWDDPLGPISDSGRDEKQSGMDEKISEEES